MKLIMAAVPFLMLSSCEENMEDLFPSEYQKVLSIKNSGQSSLVMATAAESYSVDIIVLKGGGNPSSDSEMSFRVMTDDEVAEEWNWSPSQVEIIGEEGFEIEGGDNSQDIAHTAPICHCGNDETGQRNLDTSACPRKQYR